MKRLTLLLSLAVLVLAIPIPVQGANPGWIGSCNYSHSSNDDPIVFPGKAGAAHLHDFVGATTLDANSTAASLRAGGTKCAIAGDRSSYWAPALYKNGTRVLPAAMAKNALIYYRRIGAPTGVTVQSIPEGLKMIIGNAHAHSAADSPGLGSAIIFKCGPGSGVDLAAPPSQCSSGVLVVSYRFPNCWDGKNLDSANHISHMAYPAGGKCPSSHPVAIPRVETFFRYAVGTAPIGTISFDSGPYYTAHQDFFNGWVTADLQKLVTRCINAGVDCGTNPTP